MQGRGQGRQHSTGQAGHTMQHVKQIINKYAGGAGCAINYLFNIVKGQGVCAILHRAALNKGAGGVPCTGAQVQGHTPCTLNKHQYPMSCRGAPPLENLFNVQGTVETANARAMNSAEKNKFLPCFVTRTLQAAQALGFSPCKFV